MLKYVNLMHNIFKVCTLDKISLVNITLYHQKFVPLHRKIKKLHLNY